MSRTVAIIPFRGTPTAKSRLSALFTADQRERIARHVLRHVLVEIAASGAVDHVFVVTSDLEPPAVPIELAGRATVLRQPPGRAGLNAAIELGREAAVAAGYGRMLVVLPDLPLLRGDDVRQVLEEGAAVVLAPDRHGTGTNALAVDLALNGFVFRFGEGSAARHHAEARRLGVTPATVHTPGIRHDLDTPDDWEVLPDGVRRELIAALGAPAAIACPDD